MIPPGGINNSSEGFIMEKLKNTILVIFGITGDLAQRKLLPALYHLAEADIFPAEFRVIGISRRGTTTDTIMSLIKKRIGNTPEENPEIYDRLARIISIVDMNIDRPEEYSGLTGAIEKIEKAAGHSFNRLYYLAIPSTLFRTVTNRLGQSDINIRGKENRECRFLIEKPFGYNLASAQDLIGELSENFDESQIFRIDHYLAKETAQNILAFRFENPLFCGAWNRQHISHIMITAVESIGIEGRTAFYENMGAMRDLVQSHLLQLLALVTMNRPATMSDLDIHREKEFILGRIRPPEPARMAEETVRGQYRSYRGETGNPKSDTETYAALKLSIDTDEWRDVPVFIRTGKAIKEKVTEITVVFSDRENGARKNYLTIRIQPNEGIVIDLQIKKPGFDTSFEQVQLDFCYGDKLSADHPDAYERVLVDAMRGDRTLFATSGEVLSCWRITEPVLEAWNSQGFPLCIYENGSWGPVEADRLIEESGIKWLSDTHNVCSIPRIVRKD
jgi:glucose-6-phosphate 1-dehydrogenase